MESSKARLLEQIERDRDALVGFLRGFIRCASPNPPGDTREAAAYIQQLLNRHDVEHRIIAPQETMPNIVATFVGGKPGRHLALNGHIDVFPVGDGAGWTEDPWGGALVDGRIYGRGACDMKCGTTASIFAFLYLHALREELHGRLTLSAVSDEETFGPWGARYLFEHHPEVIGDCCLNGEPSSPYTVRFGEKAVYWVKFTVRTPGGHSAYPHVSPSANRIAAALIRDLESLESIVPSTPDTVVRALGRPEAIASIERGLGKGASAILQKVTVNIGVMHGGVKVNMLPSLCEVEVDVRLPVGIARSDVRKAIDHIVARYPEVTWEDSPSQGVEATWSDPEHEMIGHIRENVQALLGFRPPAIVSLGGTDCRFWRAAGTPAYVYGCSPSGMGAPDESVSVDEFLHVVKTHTLSAYDYLRN